MFDVAVVGGGPVGSRIAGELAGRGYGVKVLERKEWVGKGVCCTGIVGRECVDAFAIDERLVQRWVNGARLFSPGGKVLDLKRDEPQAAVLDRPAFDAAMARRAEEAGAEYMLASSVRSIDIGDDRVRLGVRCSSGDITLESRFVVVAAGSASGLMGSLGLGKPGPFFGGAQVEVEVRGVEDMELYFGREVAPGFFAWLVPISGTRALAGLLAEHSPRLYLNRLLSRLSSEGKMESVAGEITYGRVLLKPLNKTYAARMVVVGGAAGQVKPTTGGGIYYGLLCADMATTVLDRALSQGCLSARALAAYERDWKQRLGGELKRGRWVRGIYQRLGDGQVDRLFDIMKSRHLDAAFMQSEGLAFDWHTRALVGLLGRGIIAKMMGLIKPPPSLFR